MALKDIRKDERFTFDEGIIINEEVFTNCIDISLGGLFIKTSKCFKAGDVLDVTLPMADLTIKTRVMHCKVGIGMGLKFQYESREQWTRVAEMIENLEASALTTGHKPQVMIVDDSKAFRGIIRNRLILDGFSVVEAEDGMDAIRQMNAYPVDALLVDLQMKRIDGLKLIGLIREAPDHKGKPIVVISGRDDTETVNKVLGAGADFFFSKNKTTPEKISTVMRSLLMQPKAPDA